jgi:lipopolysaccharide transport system ATP-binding protein
MPQPIVEIRAISKRYRLGARRGSYLSLRDEIASWCFPRRRRARNSSREFWALENVTLDVQEGTVLGIIGKNGAGKSTLLKILSQITPPTSGYITVRGRIASLLEVGTGFHAELTGRENIYLNGAILGMSRREVASRFDQIVAFAEVESFLDTPVKHYSSGMYVRLAFAVAAHLQPEILVVDEVLAVGDSSFQKKCLGKMGQVARNGRTVIFVSHNLGAIQNLCGHTALLNRGRLRSIGPTPEVIETYLRDMFQDATEMKIADRTDREGTGDVRLCSVTLLTSALEATGSIRCGEGCHLDFEYAAGRPIRDLAIAWNVRDDLGQPIFRASSADTGDDVGAFPLRGVVRCTVPRLPLAPGRYHATIEIRVGGIVADYLQGAFVLTVEAGDFYRTGRASTHSPVLLDHFWSRCAQA